MDLAVMEQVVKEILQQQKEMSADLEKESEAKKQVFIKMETYEKKLDEIKIPVNDPFSYTDTSEKMDRRSAD